jgi:hypothetical protein
VAPFRKLGVIAGDGALPRRIAAACAARGAPTHVVWLGAGAPAGEDAAGVGELGKIVRVLKEAQCDAVVLAGVVPRPNLATLSLDDLGAVVMPKVLAASRKGDGAILSILVETLEAEGFSVVGAERVVADLAAPVGPLSRSRPSEGDFADMRKASAVVAALGPFDVGQGAVVADGRVLAVEAAEGTDAMLDRCARFSDRTRRCGVLVKRPKPGQELRVDLPTIGSQTVRLADKARLSGVAVLAGAALVIDPQETRVAADEGGLFVYGFTPEEIGGAK